MEDTPVQKKYQPADDPIAQLQNQPEQLKSDDQQNLNQNQQAESQKHKFPSDQQFRRMKQQERLERIKQQKEVQKRMILQIKEQEQELLQNFPQEQKKCLDSGQEGGSPEKIKQIANRSFVQQNYDKSLLCYKMALNIIDEQRQQRQLQLKNLEPSIWFNLGMTYKKKEQTKKAKWAYQIAIEVKPDYEKALFQVMKIYEENDQQLNLALQCAKKLKKINYTLYQPHYLNLERKQTQKTQKMKNQCVDKLKGLANGVLGYFNLSLDNFKTNKNPDGTMNISFQK